MRHTFIKIGFIIYFCSYLSNTYALNLGVEGEVYPIIETDFMQLIQTRYQEMKQSGDWDKKQKEWQNTMKQYADRPSSITLPTTTKETVFSIDPSIELKRDILDEKGNILIKAGSSVNPLKLLPLRKVLFFINADDKEQIKWVLEQQKLFPANKIILVSGSISQAIHEIGNKVFFDQGGNLIRFFKLTHVPALIKQQGDRLSVKECLP